MALQCQTIFSLYTTLSVVVDLAFKILDIGGSELSFEIFKTVS